MTTDKISTDNPRGIWVVGEATNPLPGDKSFEWLFDALDHARLSSRRNSKCPVAVWDHDDIDYLFLDGASYRRVG